MGLSENQPFLLSILLIVCAADYTATSEDGCYKYRRKGNVTIDTAECLWENYTEPKTKRFCLDFCFENSTVRTQQFCHLRAWKGLVMSLIESHDALGIHREYIRLRTRRAPDPHPIIPGQGRDRSRSL